MKTTLSTLLPHATMLSSKELPLATLQLLGNLVTADDDPDGETGAELVDKGSADGPHYFHEYLHETPFSDFPVVHSLDGHIIAFAEPYAFHFFYGYPAGDDRNGPSEFYDFKICEASRQDYEAACRKLELAVFVENQGVLLRNLSRVPAEEALQAFVGVAREQPRFAAALDHQRLLGIIEGADNTTPDNGPATPIRRRPGL